jgi:hypothetical protein
MFSQNKNTSIKFEVPKENEITYSENGFGRAMRDFYKTKSSRHKGATNMYHWLVNNVCHSSKTIPCGDEFIELPEEHLVTTKSKMRRALNMTESQRRAAIYRLETDGIIKKNTTHLFTVIFIVLKAKNIQTENKHDPHIKRYITNCTNTNKLKDKIANKKNSSFEKSPRMKKEKTFKSMKQKTRTVIDQKLLKKITYKSGSPYDGTLEDWQLTLRIRKFGLERVQEAISELEIKAIKGDRVKNPNAYLHYWLKNAERDKKQDEIDKLDETILMHHHALVEFENEEQKKKELDILNKSEFARGLLGITGKVGSRTSEEVPTKMGFDHITPFDDDYEPFQDREEEKARNRNLSNYKGAKESREWVKANKKSYEQTRYNHESIQCNEKKASKHQIFATLSEHRKKFGYEK